MLKDSYILPVCQKIARRFVPQAKHLGHPDDVYDELVNVAYCACKGRTKRRGLATWIVWTLAHYVTKPSSAIRRRIRASGSSIDKRKQHKKVHDEAPITLLIMHETHDRLIQVLRWLEPEDMKLISLYFRDEKTFEQIGIHFGRSREWARMQLKSTLASLREMMPEE